MKTTKALAVKSPAFIQPCFLMKRQNSFKSKSKNQLVERRVGGRWGAGEGEGGERGEADVNTSLLEFLGQSLTPALSLFFFFSCRIQQPVRSSEGFVGFMIKCEKMSLLVCVSMLVQLVGCSLWPYGLIARSLSLSFDLCVCGLVMWRRRRWCNELHIQPPPPLSNTR